MQAFEAGAKVLERELRERFASCLANHFVWAVKLFQQDGHRVGNVSVANLSRGGGLDHGIRVVHGIHKRSRVRTSRPLHEVKRGAPVPVVLGIVAVVLVVGIFAASKLWDKGAVGFNPSAAYARAKAYNDSGDHARAEAELRKLEGESVPADLFAKVQALKKELASVDDVRSDGRHEEKGTEYLDTQLVRFEKDRLQGEPEKEKVRVFLKRCRHFRQTWPDHEGIDWVNRHEGRFQGYVNLSDPPTFKDIEYEIETMTWAKPRDYRTAFQVLADFEENGPSNQQDLALALREEMSQARQEYFVDRMEQAAWLWEREERGQAVEWLVQLIIKVGDDAMETEAAQEMIALPGIVDLLRAYRRDRPETFEALVEQDLVRDLARENDML